MFDKFCHHPLKKGFDYFYGTPVSNMRDFSGGAGNTIKKDLPPLKLKDIWESIACIAFILLLYKLNVCGKLGVLFTVFILVSVHSYLYVSDNYYRFFNSMIMRNYDTVEQPINFEGITQKLINEGVKFIEEREADKSPFLLVMSWLQVHTVLHASERFKGKSLHGGYGDEVEEMDWSVGEIIKALERLGLLDNTLVFFTSDNGGHLEERRNGINEGGWNGIYRGRPLN